jgi:hypothetical protein
MVLPFIDEGGLARNSAVRFTRLRPRLRSTKSCSGARNSGRRDGSCRIGRRGPSAATRQPWWAPRPAYLSESQPEPTVVISFRIRFCPSRKRPARLHLAPSTMSASSNFFVALSVVVQMTRATYSALSGGLNRSRLPSRRPRLKPLGIGEILAGAETSRPTAYRALEPVLDLTASA